MNAVLRREYGIRPERLSDKAWVKLYAEYRYTEQNRLENLRLVVKSALIEVLNAAFGGSK